MLNYEMINKDQDLVREQAPLIVLDKKPAVCMVKNIKDTKPTRHISRKCTL